MIRLSSGEDDSGQITVALPEYKVETPVYSDPDPETGDRELLRVDVCIPSITMTRPSTATFSAAQAAARRVIPAQNEGETDKAYRERINPVIERLGFDKLSGKAALQDAVSGIVDELLITQLARIHVIAWEGFGDHDGNPVEPTEEAVAQAMRDPVITHHVKTALYGRHFEVAAEGNA